MTGYEFFANPWTQVGLGILGGNIGASGSEAFANAMRSGAQQAQTASWQHMQRGQADLQNQLLRQQLEREKQEMDQLRLLQERAPNIAAGLSSMDPAQRTSSREELMGLQPNLLGQLLLNQMAAGAKMSSPMRIYEEAGGQEGTGKRFGDWYTSDYKGGGTTVAVNTGSIPSGFRQRETEEGVLVQEPIAGSPEDIKRKEGLIALQGVYDDITELEDLISEYGTEAFGPTARRMKSLRNRIIGNLPAIRQTGVLQEGELQRIEQELPKGESIFTPGGMVLPLVSGFREEVERTLNAKRALYGMEPAAPADEESTMSQDDEWKIERVR